MAGSMLPIFIRLNSKILNPIAIIRSPPTEDI